MRYTGRKGWQASYKDTWSLDYTLSPIIHAGLVKFRETMDGNKSDWFGVPKSILDSDYEGKDNDPKYLKAFEVWKGVIDKMIHSFDPNHFEDYFKWSDMEELKELERKHNEGLELFSKHYDDLWW